MTANITVFTKERQYALRIPAKALNFSPDAALNSTYKLLPAKQVELAQGDNGTGKTRSAYVWIKKGNILEQRLIKIGIDDNTQVEVIYGITALDLVVVSLLEPGQVTEQAVMSASGSNKR